jgi:5-enolpyruvylshikimate-3-phosphate synthase
MKKEESPARLLPSIPGFAPTLRGCYVSANLSSAFVSVALFSAAIAEKNHQQQEEEKQTVVIEHAAIAKYDHQQQEEKQQAVAVLALFVSPAPKQSTEDTTH